MKTKIYIILLVVFIISVLTTVPSWAQTKGPDEAKPEDKAKTPAKEESQEELAKATQNPVADMVSFPLQNNIGFNFGPDKQTHSNPSVEISLRKSISSPKKTRPNSEPSRFTMPT